MSKKVKLAAAAKQPKAIVLDIEGTVAPISFVTETLFPYARQRIRDHLSSTYDTEETQADIVLLRDQVHPHTTLSLLTLNDGPMVLHHFTILMKHRV